MCLLLFANSFGHDLNFVSQYALISRPGPSQGLLNKHLRHSFIHSVSEPFPPTALWRRHAQTGRDRASSYKIDYVIVIKNFLNPEGHQNPISGSKVTAILLKGWILPIGGASAGEGLPCSLVFCMPQLKKMVDSVSKPMIFF